MNSIVKDTSQYNTLLMHLIKKWRGPQGVLNLLSQKNERWWKDFTCFKFIKEELKVFIFFYQYACICCTYSVCMFAHIAHT